LENWKSFTWIFGCSVWIGYSGISCKFVGLESSIVSLPGGSIADVGFAFSQEFMAFKAAKLKWVYAKIGHHTVFWYSASSCSELLIPNFNGSLIIFLFF